MRSDVRRQRASVNIILSAEYTSGGCFGVSGESGICMEWFLIVGVRFKASFDIEFLSFLIRICFRFSHVCVQVDAFRVQ